MIAKKTATFLLMVILCELMFFNAVQANPGWWRRRRRRCSSGTPSGVAWVNNWQASFTFSCRNGYSVRQWRSEHRNCKEDRIHFFRCDGGPVVGNNGYCVWTNHYVNDYDHPVNFKCPQNGFIAGIRSEYNSRHKDRRFGFRCCYVSPGYSHHNCKLTPYQNNWDQPLNYYVPNGLFLVGVHSYHHSHYEDRRWRFEICEIRH